MDKFLKLFEGMELTPEFQEKLKAVFEEALENKMLEKETEEDELVDEECATKNDEEEVVKEAEGEEDSTLVTVDPMELVKDPDIRRILSALKINPMQFARSLKASIVDITGNTVGDDSFSDLLVILDAIAKDSNLATRLAMNLKKMSAEKNGNGNEEEVPVTEEEEKEEEIEEINEELIKNVDKYLSYVAEEWMTENKLAVENGIKTELVESFIHGLKGLFTEHNMEVPETVSVVEKLNQKIEKLTENLNESIDKNIQLKSELSDVKNSAAKELLAEKATNLFNTKTAHLPVTTVERLKKLNETFTYSDIDEYNTKLNVIIESVQTDNSKKKVLKEEDLNEDLDMNTNIDDDPKMLAYSEAISKNSRF